MNVYGITGGIGMGKSACSDWLSREGYQIVDTDLISRELTTSDPVILSRIGNVFGESVFSEGGDLERGKLAEIIFKDDSKRSMLESILHPAIREMWQSEIRRLSNEGVPVVSVVIPLLYETTAEDCFDAVICVACSAATQNERLEKRGWDPKQIHARNAAQMPIQDKMLRSNYVIWTEGAMASTEEQLKMVLRRLG